MATLTFNDIINAGYTYPASVPDDLQAVILSWYKNRYVANDDYFSDWFTRILEKDMPRYNQLLRIEPGYAEYDWAVTTYRERQVKETGSGETSQTSQSSATNTPDRTETVTHTGTVTGAKEYDSKTAHGGNDKTEGSTSTTASGSSTDAHTGTDEVAKKYGKTETRGGSDTVTSTGKTTDTSTDTTTGTTTTAETTDARAMSRALPMSQSYTMSGTGDDVVAATSDRSSGLPAALDWTTATSAQENDGASNRTVTENTTVSHSGETDTSATQETAYGSNTAQTGTDTDTTTFNDTMTGSTSNESSGSNSETKTYNSDTTHTGTDTDTTTYNETTTRSIAGGDTDTKTGSVTGSESRENLRREIWTGRDAEIARIMDFAKGFIISTNAWEWLSRQIDTVFMGVYDV